MSTNRRTFFGEVLGGAAGVAVSGLVSSAPCAGGQRPHPLRPDRRAAARGMEIFKAAIQCPNVEAVAVADVYTRRLDEVKTLVPQIKTYRDFRQLLDDKSDRCRPHRHAAAPARPELRPRHSGRQGRVSGKDHGVQSGPRPAHAQGVSRVRTRGPDRHADEQRAGPAEGPGTGHARAHGRSSPPSRPITYRNAPYGGWLQGDSVGLRRRARRLDRFRRRSRTLPLRSAALHELAVLTGITRAATCSRTWSTRWGSGTRRWG